MPANTVPPMPEIRLKSGGARTLPAGWQPANHLMRVARRSALLPALMALGIMVADAAAETANRPFVELQPFDSPPVIDGRLDDRCWQSVQAITNFTQVLPVEGAAPTERTEVRFGFDRDYLYVAIRCFDSEPSSIIAKQLKHDSPFDSDDVVTLALDTFGRERDGYLFAVNPAGARAEAVFGRFSWRNYGWDTVWVAKTTIDGEGWTAELAIPAKSLSFDPRAVWRVNIERTIRRKQETVRWTGISSRRSITDLEDYGELRGLRALRQGRGLEFKPYLRGDHQTGPAAPSQGFGFDAGFDLTYRINPTLTAVATMRPDFAETEVDDRVVNLTRFPQFFPEKRDFLLQDVALFSFGGLGDWESPYYSRRIGQGNDGLPVEILAGGRLTGRLNDTSVAVLDVQQAGHNGIEPKNLAVVRVAQQVLDESSVGLIGTFRRPNHQQPGVAWRRRLRLPEFTPARRPKTHRRRLLYGQPQR